mgnify:FL=1
MREHGKRVAAWFLTVVMVITMIMPYGGAGIPFADWVKAADLIDLSGKDGAHKVTVVATTETGLGNYYTGEAIEAPVTVKVDGEEVPSDCYDVVYTNNVNVSTATELAVATITGKPEKGYTGSNTAKFKIRVTPINKAKVKFASDMTLVSGKYYVPYVKNLANSPTVESVTWNGKVLVAEKDYYENVTLSENYLEIGSKGTTVIKGMNNFSGSKTYTWYLKAANIQDQIITLSNSNYSYDGKEKKPSVTIADVNSWLDENNDYQYLEEGVDYTLSYSNNTNAGTASVTITGINCYTGTKTVNFTITNSSSGGDTGTKDISAASVTVASCTYNGTAQTPAVTVKDGSTTLRQGTDYTVQYASNTNAGTGTVTITGCGKYRNTKTATFTIARRNLSNATLTAATETYNYGASVTSSNITVKDNGLGRTLTNNTDYTIGSYNAVNVGNVTITATGKGNYTGTVSGTFTVNALNVSSVAAVTLNQTEFTQTGSEIKPTVTAVTAGGHTLTAGTDYTVSYQNNTAVGTAAKVIVTFKGNYTGSKTVYFTIKSNSSSGGDTETKDISTATVTVASCTYNGQAQTPAVTVKDGSTTLKQGTDYTVSYSANTNAGNGTVMISGCGKYTNTKSLTFKINPRDISKATLTAEPATYKYGAEVFSPKISVYDSKLGTTLTNKIDYTVASYVAKTAGTVSISATGKGNYTGTVTGTLTVNPLDVTNTAKVTLNQTSFDQTGAEIRPTVTSVTSDGYTLTEGTDYTVSYKDNVAAGNLAKVIVTFKGNYTGSKTVYFTIISSLPDLSGAVCSTIADQTYTGAQIKPEVTVTYDGKTLTKDSDYTVSYGANVNCGTGTVTITGKNGYSGTKSVNFKISARALADCSLSYDESVKWTGSAATPNIRITYGQKLLIEGTDYTVAYSNNINETTAATATVTGKGNFTGRKVLTYKITRDRTDVNASTITVDAIADQEYNAGQGLRPAVTVRNGGTILTLNTDYTVTYTNNYTAGSTAIVTITGINDYTGTRTATFNVVALDLTNAKVVLEADSYEYTGMPQTPGVTSFTTVSGKTYTSMTNFTVSYSNNTNCGTATVTIKGKNANFTGSAEGTFTVTKKSIKGAVFSNITACTFTGSEQKPTATVKIGTTTLAANADYELSYENNINAGTGKITATGKGNYSGSAKTTFTIAARAITSCKAEYSKEMIYTGSEVKPSVKLTYGSYELKAGTDYTVSYSNNINETDSASIRITGNGNFSGTQTCTFKITKIVTNINDSSISIASIGDKEYQGGEAIIPKLRITQDGVTLVEGESYTITVTNNKTVGSTATITIQGIGAYTGTRSLTFKIVAADITGAEVALVQRSYEYTGAAFTPAVVSLTTTGGKRITNLSEFSVSYSGNTNVGTATVTVTGTGSNYKGTTTGTFAITRKSLNDSLVMNVGTVTYTGSALSPDITVTFNGKTLTKGKDYAVAFTNNINAGTAKAKITGLGNYDGTVEKTFTILPFDINNGGFIMVTGSPYTYTGGELKPGFTVMISGRSLAAVNYDVAYSNNVNVGTATITVTGKGNYKGTITENFTIQAKPLKDASVTYANLMSYTGKQVCPEVKVMDGAVELKQNVDYDVSYQNNTEVTTSARIQITGKGNYTGTIDRYFSIQKQEINLKDAEITAENQTYNGREQKPAVTVKVSGRVIDPSEYSVLYSENINAGTARITVNGLSDSFKNTGYGTFTILPKQIEKCKVSYTKSVSYTGKAVTPSVIVKDTARNAVLSAGASADYTVSYQSNTEPTTKAVIQITGNGNYTGTLTQYFAIVKQTTPVTKTDLSAAVITVADQTYTGKALTPAVTVTLKGKVLKLNTDYTAAYSNNTNVGTAKVVITGKGNYTGSASKTFVIKAKTTPNVKKPGVTKKITVSKIKTTSAKITWKKVSDADGYMIYQKQGSGKKKLIKTVGKNASSYNAKKLKAGTKYTYSVYAYKKSGNSKIKGKEKSKAFVTKPSKVKSVKTTAKSKACKISWKKVAGASGYQVYMATSKKGKYKKIGDTKKLNLTKKSLKKGKTYYFKVRAYKTLNKKKTYGAYSVKVKAKIK